MNDRIDCVVTVKQLFETYVYRQILSSADLLPFVITPWEWRARSHATASMESIGHGKRLVER
jgi:hypothetical protein